MPPTTTAPGIHSRRPLRDRSPWKLLELAHAHGGVSAAHRLGLARSDRPRELGLDEVAGALRLVAALTGLPALGRQRTVRLYRQSNVESKFANTI